MSISSDTEQQPQAIFRPSSDQPSHKEVKIVKFLEINSLGVNPTTRVRQTMLPGLLASQRIMYNRLSD